MNPLIITLGGRRYIFAVASLIFITVLCAFKCMTGAEYVLALGIVNAIYSGANVAQKKIEGNSDADSTKS